MNMHLKICATLFKTNYYNINFNIKRSSPEEGLWKNSGVKNLLEEQLALRQKTPYQLYLTSRLSMKATGLGFSTASKDITQGFQ